MDPGAVEFDFGDFGADCPARAAVDLFANTWLPVVVYELRNGPERPSRLQRSIGGISQKVLTQTLRRLEREGLVQRRRYPESPPRVEYELTEPGRDLLIPIRALGAWAYRHADTISAARRPRQFSRRRGLADEPGVARPTDSPAASRTLTSTSTEVLGSHRISHDDEDEVRHEHVG